MNTVVRQIRITSLSLNMLCFGQCKSKENMYWSTNICVKAR